jgi:hypothetical protein
MVQVSPLDHDGNGDKWVLFYCYQRFQSDGSYTDEWILQHCQPLVDYDLNVNWNDNCLSALVTDGTDSCVTFSFNALWYAIRIDRHLCSGLSRSALPHKHILGTLAMQFLPPK